MKSVFYVINSSMLSSSVADTTTTATIFADFDFCPIFINRIASVLNLISVVVYWLYLARLRSKN